MYTIYGLNFDDGRIYVGMTDNLARRIKEHKRGRTKSTKNRGDFKIIKIEECDNRVTAREREKYWKSGCGKEQLKFWSGSSAG
jgi:putative endonuclease